MLSNNDDVVDYTDNVWWSRIERYQVRQVPPAILLKCGKTQKIYPMAWLHIFKNHGKIIMVREGIIIFTIVYCIISMIPDDSSVTREGIKYTIYAEPEAHRILVQEIIMVYNT